MDDPRATAEPDQDATRRRLMRFISAETYRPDLLSRIARISKALRDEGQAGRYWLLSDAAGPEVDAAVDVFVKGCDGKPWRIAAELPRFKSDWNLDAYAPAAKARIARLGLEAELAKRRPGGALRRPRWLSALRRMWKR